LHALHADLANNLAYSALGSGDLDRAEELLLEALAIGRGRKDVIAVTAALGNLGTVAQRRGRLADAAQAWDECLEIAQRDGLGMALAGSSAGVALMMASWGDAMLSGRVLGAVQELVERIAEPLQPVEQDLYDQAVAMDAEALGKEALAHAIEAGGRAGADVLVPEARSWLATTWDLRGRRDR
jgi:tetratricopeptide (TPR) repeat protein